MKATVYWTPHLLPDFGKIQYKKYENNAGRWVQVLGKSAQKPFMFLWATVKLDLCL